MSDSENMLMDHESLTVRQPKVRHWVWIGLAVATVGFVAVVSNSFRPQHRTPMMHIAHGHSLMRAFTDRLLEAQASQGHESSAHFVINEAGAEAPSAMSINCHFSPVDEPEAVSLLTFRAKEGQQADLQTHMNNILDEVLNMTEKMQGPEAADMFRQKVSVVLKGDNHVGIHVINPEYPSDMDEDFKSNPKLELNLSFGSGLTEMMQKKEAHFPVALKGMSVDGSTVVTGAVLKDLEGKMPKHMEKELDIARLLVSESVSLELLYKPDGDFSALPTVGDLAAMLGQHLSQFPASILEKLKGLDELVDGVSSLTTGGLPGSHRMEVNFNNFHVAPWLKEVIENMPEKEPMMWG